MQTIDVNNNSSSETHYVTLADIQNTDPCSFPGGLNPITQARCKESFQSRVAQDAAPVISSDPMDQLYFASLAGVGLYILYRFMEKSR
jgi:hypothetical protein